MTSSVSHSPVIYVIQLTLKTPQQATRESTLCEIALQLVFVSLVVKEKCIPGFRATSRKMQFLERNEALGFD